MSQRVEPRRTPIDHEELRNALRKSWGKVRSDEPPHVAISILLAQSALETNRWGACWNFNLGGVKGSTNAPHFYLSTLERLTRPAAIRELSRSTTAAPCELVEDKAGESTVVVRFLPAHPTCRFRAWGSLQQAADDLVRLKAHRYAASLNAAARGDLRGYVVALRAGGYFTAKVEDYIAGVERHFLEYAFPCLSDELEIGTALELLGYDGPDYRENVIAFQRDSGLKVDGNVGPKTRAAIRRHIID